MQSIKLLINNNIVYDNTSPPITSSFQSLPQNNNLDDNGVDLSIYKRIVDDNAAENSEVWFLDEASKKMKKGKYRSESSQKEGFATYYIDNKSYYSKKPLYELIKRGGGAERREEKRRVENPEENITRKNNFEYN
jgi:hypothetical protein